MWGPRGRRELWWVPPPRPVARGTGWPLLSSPLPGHVAPSEPVGYRELEASAHSGHSTLHIPPTAMRCCPCSLIVLALASSLTACAPLRQATPRTSADLQIATTPSPVCAFTIETVKSYKPAGALPTIWVKVNDPVVVRLWSSAPDPHVRLSVAAERVFVTSDSVERDETSGVSVVRSLPADTRGRSRVAEQCPSTELYYSDIIIDDALGDRSRVYHLAVEFGGDPTDSTASFAVNVQRYRPVHFELATGPLLTLANLDEYTLVRSSGDSLSAVLSEREGRGRTSLAVGAILRPWGANPYTMHGRPWWRHTGFYVSSPVTSDFAKAFSVGLALGGHGITFVGGTHVRTAAVPVDGVTPGVPFTPQPGRDTLEDVTRTRLRFGGFVGLQLDLGLFSRLFASNESTVAP